MYRYRSAGGRTIYRPLEIKSPRPTLRRVLHACVMRPVSCGQLTTRRLFTRYWKNRLAFSPLAVHDDVYYLWMTSPTYDGQLRFSTVRQGCSCDMWSNLRRVADEISCHDSDSSWDARHGIRVNIFSSSAARSRRRAVCLLNYHGNVLSVLQLPQNDFCRVASRRDINKG